jgi:hypothetical protein
MPASRLVRWTVAGVSCALLAAPGVARLLGHPGAPIENRAPAAFTGLDDGWDSFAALGRYVNDRLPLRARAVRADAWIDQHVFGEDPAFGGGSSPRVVTGSNGVLFINDALTEACAPNATPDVSASRLAALAAVIAESGRELVTMVAPDKSTIHPELLPPDLATRACFDAYTERFWAELDGAAIPGFVNLRDLLIARSTTTRELLYLRKDSHWDPAGSLVAVERAVDAFAPGLWDPAAVQYQGLYDYTGDLTGLLGAPAVDQAPSYGVVRPQITEVSVEVIDDLEGGANRRFVNAGPDGSLIPGRTLFLLDSYGLAALPQVVPYFEDLTIVNINDFEPERFAQLIADADRVWFMSVERSTPYRMAATIGAPEFTELLASKLRG